MFDKLYPQVWMSLPTEAKQVLIKYFGIKRTGMVEVFNSEVKSDGYTQQDLSVISVESMSSFIGAEEKLSFHSAWELTLKKIEFILNPPPADYVQPEIKETPLKKDEQPTGVTTVGAPSTTEGDAGNSLETQVTELLNTSTTQTGDEEINSSKKYGKKNK